MIPAARLRHFGIEPLSDHTSRIPINPAGVSQIALTGSGAYGNYGQFIVIQSGTTPNSKSTVGYFTISPSNTNGTGGGSASGLNWTVRCGFAFRFTAGGGNGLNANGIWQAAFRAENGGGALVQTGIALERRHSRFWIRCHDGSGETVEDTGIDYIPNIHRLVELISNADGTVTFWLNSAPVYTVESGGPIAVVNQGEGTLRFSVTGTDAYDQQLGVFTPELIGG